MNIDHRLALERFHTQTSWLDSWHSFSFSHHFDRSNVKHGLLLVSNDDVVAPGKGFGWHPHDNMEIVTWVLEGELEHGDTMGNRGLIVPGQAQRMSAGRGVRHQEMNPSASHPVHFVQMWVEPDVRGIEPEYEQRDFTLALADGELVPVASGRGHDGALRIHQRDAVLWIGRLPPGKSIQVPTARWVHLFVARGSSSYDGDKSLSAGDALRLTGEPSRELRAGSGGAEVLIWEMRSQEQQFSKR